jgi:hypothetical protein
MNRRFSPRSLFACKHEEAVVPLNREEIIRALGEVDEVIVAQIIASGATAHELAEARAWISNNEPLLNSGKPLPSGRVGRLTEILSKLEEEKADPPLGPS